MDREAEHEKIRQMLTATIVSLCNNSLLFDGEMTIQGLLGITLDRRDIILVNIQESIGRQGSKVTHNKSQSYSSVAAAAPDVPVVKMESLQAPVHQVQCATQCTTLQPFTASNSVQSACGVVDNSMGTTGQGRGGVISQALGWNSQNNAAVTYNEELSSNVSVPGYIPTTALASSQPSVVQQIKLEPCSSEFTTGSGRYYGVDGETGYDQYECYYDQGSGTSSAGSGLYTDVSGTGSVGSAGAIYGDEQYVRDIQQQKFNRQPTKKRVRNRQSNKVPTTPSPASTTAAVPSCKDVNSSLVQRALDLVQEGQLTAGVAIKLFGIPRSTFYKKLSMCSQPNVSKQTDTDSQYYAAGEYSMDDYVGASNEGDSLVGKGEWGGTDSGASYTDYYMTTS